MDQDPIAQLVLRRLQQRRMTIVDLAARAEIDRGIIGRWLSGVRTIRLAHALKVMRILGIVAVLEEDLHGRTDATPPHAPRPHRPAKPLPRPRPRR